MTKQSVIMLHGQLKASHKRHQANLINEQGQFPLRLDRQISLDPIPSDPVTIVGYLTAFYSHPHQHHHAIIETKAYRMEPLTIPLVGASRSLLYTYLCEMILSPQGIDMPTEAMGVISGTISSQLHHGHKQLSFTLDNDDGSFPIAIDYTQTALKPIAQKKSGDTLTMLVRLQTIYKPQCRYHHLWCLPVMTLANSEIWNDIWDQVGVPLSMALSTPTQNP
ncbi:MAG: hypothetical protein AAF629_00305 [Chloroflexota bacterium]